jgi:hypothetical protein
MHRSRTGGGEATAGELPSYRRVDELTFLARGGVLS